MEEFISYKSGYSLQHISNWEKRLHLRIMTVIKYTDIIFGPDHHIYWYSKSNVNLGFNVWHVSICTAVMIENNMFGWEYIALDVMCYKYK